MEDEKLLGGVRHDDIPPTLGKYLSPIASHCKIWLWAIVNFLFIKIFSIQYTDGNPSSSSFNLVARQIQYTGIPSDGAVMLL